MRRKSLAGLTAIRRARTYLPVKTRKVLYQSLVLPHLDYCCVVRNSYGTGLSDRLERVQNYAMRMILKKPPRTCSEELRQSLGWKSLKTRRHNAMLRQVHQCINNQAPPYMVLKFTQNSSLGYNHTRGADSLHIRQPESRHYHSSFEFQGVKHFNTLPAAVRAIRSGKTFLKAIARIR